MKISNTLSVLIWFLCMSVLTTCKNSKEHKEKVNTLESVVEGVLNKKLNIPDSLEIYSPFSNGKAIDKDILNAEYKIYSKIDASCGTCIGHINGWNELVPEFYKYKVPIILICSSDDNFELLKYFCEKGAIKNFGYPFFLDKKNTYFENNKFMEADINFETVLTDRNNNIIALGNPLESNGIKNLFLKEIQKRISD